MTENIFQSLFQIYSFWLVVALFVFFKCFSSSSSVLANQLWNPCWSKKVQGMSFPQLWPSSCSWNNDGHPSNTCAFLGLQADPELHTPLLFRNTQDPTSLTCSVFFPSQCNVRNSSMSMQSSCSQLASKSPSPCLPSSPSTASETHHKRRSPNCTRIKTKILLGGM